MSFQALPKETVMIICESLKDSRAFLCVFGISIQETSFLIDEYILFWELYKIILECQANHASFCGISGTKKNKQTEEKIMFYKRYIKDPLWLSSFLDSLLYVYKSKFSVPPNFGCEWRFPEYITKENKPENEDEKYFLSKTSFTEITFGFKLLRKFLSFMENNQTDEEFEYIKKDQRYVTVVAENYTEDENYTEEPLSYIYEDVEEM